MYSMLKSDPNLTIAQTTHCDQDAIYSYKRALKSIFSAIVGVKKHSFLDIKPSKDEPTELVLVESGDFLFVSNYIPHCGCENLTDYEHHCIHFFMILQISKIPGQET